MAEGEDFEMNDLGKEKEREEEEEDTDETSLTDEDQEAVATGQTSAGDGITHVTEETSRPNSSFSLDSGSRAHERSVTENKKRLIMNTLEIQVNKGDGKKSSELLLGVSPVYSRKTGKLIGLKFNNERVRKLENGKFVYNEGKSNREAVESFKKLLREVEEEHSKKISGAIEKANNDPTTPQKVVNDVASQTISKSESALEERGEDLQKQAREILTENEAREFMGMLEPKGTSVQKIGLLETEVRYYREQAASEKDPRKRQLYEKFSEVAEMKADTIRIRIGDAPEHIDVLSILGDEVENNDLNKLERFKKWAKGNMVGLSAIAITIAGIITTIVVAARKAVSGGARAVGGFAKALANLGKSLGPLLAPLFSVIAQVLTWGAKGIAWLANNLWILAIAMTWLLYDYWKNRK